MRPRAAALPLLALLASACTQGDRPARIFVAAPLTGDAGVEGQGVLRAVRMAVAEAEEARLLRFPVEVRAMDDRADPKEALNVANLIAVDPAAAAVIGHYNSGCAMAAAPVYARAALPMLTPSASHPQLTLRQKDPSWGPRNVFRLVANDAQQGVKTAEFLHRRLGVKRLSVAHDDTAYGRDLARIVRERFEALGGTVVSRDEIRPGRKDFSALAEWVKSVKPDAVYFGGFYTEAGLLLKELRAKGVEAPFVSGDGAKTGGLFAVAGKAADGAYLSAIGPPAENLPGARDFVKSYRARYKEELKPFDHFAYEATWLVLDALGKYGPDRGALLAELRRADRWGILGRVRFDENGDLVGAAVTFLRADAEKKAFVPVR